MCLLSETGSQEELTNQANESTKSYLYIQRETAIETENCFARCTKLLSLKIKSHKITNYLRYNGCLKCTSMHHRVVDWLFGLGGRALENLLVQ